MSSHRDCDCRTVASAPSSLLSTTPRPFFFFFFLPLRRRSVRRRRNELLNRRRDTKKAAIIASQTFGADNNVAGLGWRRELRKREREGEQIAIIKIERQTRGSRCAGKRRSQPIHCGINSSFTSRSWKTSTRQRIIYISKAL